MLDNIIPFPVSAEPELEEPDWEHLIEELQRAHKFMGEYDPPSNIEADIPAFAMADLTQWLIRERQEGSASQREVMSQFFYSVAFIVAPWCGDQEDAEVDEKLETILRLSADLEERLAQQ
ncbi:hypothetical protein SAMN05216196_102509 [Lutimaribacter pacificus]|uniref:Uncharacterized protein n=1 Tax=Lutimaribacter pacificus TaxID=391948 RepID=A0A1H0F874_9RHOB|nr:hypothetical protein [Lutimaribacter pacificus]SDN90795.1 hypothetical protein SAMN05216196_102509 [Lutimaribacter pacificus]SHK46045.1 hypothetical protein SAMN05444142_105223 [Lutimaribacter pacificus]